MRIVMAMPRYGPVVFEATTGFYQPITPDSEHSVEQLAPCGSLLNKTFNLAWCYALNGHEAGRVDGFAMQHADIQTPAGWLDLLSDEMERCGADVISVVVPIKDKRGRTSTAIAGPDEWHRKVLTLREVHSLPETFTDADVQERFGGRLLLNTGVWLCKLGPWANQVHFQCKDRIRRNDKGQWQAEVVPEDWDFSAQCHRLGVKLAATRKVNVIHHGGCGFDNSLVWGTETAEGAE